MFRTHDSLNLPTFIHVSLLESPEIRKTINLPFSFRLEDPTLERIAVKKMRSVEKGYTYPSIDIVFVRGETSLSRNGMSNEEAEKSCGFYQSVQTVSKSPVDYSDAPKHDSPHNMNGYLIFAYKTMEDMHTQKFTDSWKTWSGARMLCSRMPPPHAVTKLSFYKRVSGQLNFEYFLIAKIKNMMVDAAPALNVLNYMKPKVCAYAGAYRKISFEVNKNLCESLGLVDANYVNALTDRMRVTYSNNTGYIELSEFIEFYCKEEEEEIKQAALLPKRKSAEVQTDPTESSKHSRRTLPRTLSAIPVPGTSTCSSPASLFHSPDSLINSIIENKNKIVSIGNNFLLVIDNRDIDQKETLEMRELERIRELQEYNRIQNNQLTNYEEQMMRYCNDNENKVFTSINDEDLLKRLKTEYFNSEEYTAAELCQLTPE